MRVRYGFIQWRFPHRPPLRGWPQVLYWCKIMSSVCTEQDELIDNFKRDTGASDVPFLYTTCVEVIDDAKMYKAQDPERVLRQRIKKLETTMRDKFPLFADDMIAEEKEKKKTSSTLIKLQRISGSGRSLQSASCRRIIFRQKQKEVTNGKSTIGRR